MPRQVVVGSSCFVGVVAQKVGARKVVLKRIVVRFVVTRVVAKIVVGVVVAGKGRVRGYRGNLVPCLRKAAAPSMVKIVAQQRCARSRCCCSGYAAAAAEA